MDYDLIRIIIIGVVAVILYYIITILTGSNSYPNSEGFQTETPGQPQAQGQPQALGQSQNNLSEYRPINPNTGSTDKLNTNVLPYPQISNNYAPQAELQGQFDTKTGTQPLLDCFPKDTVTPQELMPREGDYNAWQQSNPPVNGHLADRNFLESGHHYGIDTVSNSLKNPNKQLRSDPVIPQIAVGPWSQSTYSPDTNRRQLEIGGDY